MGQFLVEQRRADRAIERLVAPNLLHDEGCDYVLRRMFPVDGGFAAVRNDFQLCIGGVTCLGRMQTPNGTLEMPIPYERKTTYADITSVFANEGGAYGATHAGILGYSRKAVSFEILDQGRSALVRTEQRDFANAIPWAPLGSYDPDEFKPPDFGWPAWKPEHRYPWDKPTWKPNYWGDSGEAGAWSDMLTNNPATGATFSVGVAFIVSPASPPILLCSARFTRCLVIRPGDALWVRYAGRVRPGVAPAGGVTTSAFVSRLARRAWANDAQAEPGNYRAALAVNAPGSLDLTATWSDVVELDDASNPGYAPAPLTSWAKGSQPYEVVAQCAGFQNTGAEPWQPVHWFCVLADFDASPVLCWLEPLNPPDGLVLSPGDRFVFPDGVAFSLRDGGG